MENLLITGGAGFIGSSFINRLLDSGYGADIICVDDFNDYYSPAVKRNNIKAYLSHPRFFLHQADITDYSSMEKIFTKHDIKVIVHLAARAGVRPSIKDPLLYEQVNVKGTLNLLELARKNSIDKFIFASSSSVYGNNQKVPFAEDDNVDFPISPYAATKKSGELLCHTYFQLYNIQCFCLRFFTVYGPRQRPEMAIHKFIRCIDEGNEIEMYGTGETSRDYTYIGDIIQGLEACLRRIRGYQIINLGNSSPISLAGLISLLELKMGKKAKIKKMDMQPGDVLATYASIDKAKKLLDYNPSTPLEKGIEKFINWYYAEED